MVIPRSIRPDPGSLLGLRLAVLFSLPLLFSRCHFVKLHQAQKSHPEGDRYRVPLDLGVAPGSPKTGREPRSSLRLLREEAAASQALACLRPLRDEVGLGLEKRGPPRGRVERSNASVKRRHVCVCDRPFLNSGQETGHRHLSKFIWGKGGLRSTGTSNSTDR